MALSGQRTATLKCKRTDRYQPYYFLLTDMRLG